MFTSVFALEMLLKLLACGPLGYIRNPYNIFDGIIVVIRWSPVSRLGHGARDRTPAPPREQSPSRRERACWQCFWQATESHIVGRAGSPPWDQVPSYWRCQLHAVHHVSECFQNVVEPLPVGTA